MPPSLALEHSDHSAADDATAQPSKPFWRLLNLSLGFLGIQFGWAIQMGQMGPLLESLGSEPWITNFISCAGPITGILVQPIVGALSDQNTSRWGRRRPFILAGALLTAISMILMPNSPNLLTAAVLLWVLDASLNITQGPYRAMVPDSIPRHQHGTTYSLMGLTIGLGSVIAFYVGSLIPDMHQLFYLGATALTGMMVWTVVSNREEPIQAEDVAIKHTSLIIMSAEAGEINPEMVKKSMLVTIFKDTFGSIAAMPDEAKKLCLAHSFTWLGLACLFVYFSLYVPHNVFGSWDTKAAPYKEGVQWVSSCYLMMNIVCLVASAVVSGLCNKGVSRKAIHTAGLSVMGLSLISMFVLHEPMTVMIAMACVGIGWATTLSIPFAMLSEHMPKGKEGVLMGAFNMFIAAPQVMTAILVGPVVAICGNNVAVAMLMGGGSMLISAILLQRVHEQKTLKMVSATEGAA